MRGQGAGWREGRGGEGSEGERTWTGGGEGAQVMAEGAKMAGSISGQRSTKAIHTEGRKAAAIRRWLTYLS